ncbi:hypothetical protein Bca4012_067491 [Brassica carinata]|uniref:Lipoyl-binding domain-containing protein n=1 Tax=Brassica carinata TaxID=52824 RepID=A0A8X7VRZ9_BRACI|nr:hypothetical protein Bca52824_019756 [Brassica carinata]
MKFNSIDKRLVTFLVLSSKVRLQLEGDVVEAVVPHMGESITDGNIDTFLKKPGDRVEADEAIAQTETDRVTIDIASPANGVIQEFLVKEGDTVEPGNK